MTLAAIPGDTLARRLQEATPDAVVEWDDASVWVRPESMGAVAAFLHDDADLDFVYLNAVSAIDFVEHFRAGVSHNVAGKGTHGRSAQPGVRT